MKRSSFLKSVLVGCFIFGMALLIPSLILKIYFEFNPIIFWIAFYFGYFANMFIRLSGDYIKFKEEQERD